MRQINKTHKSTDYKRLLIFIIIVTVQFSISFSRAEDAEVLMYNTKIKFENGKLKKSNNYEIRINNRKGEKYTDIEIPFSKLNKVKQIEAYIEDNSGNIIKKLKTTSIITKSKISDFSFYEDNFVKVFSLKHVVYPYVLCYKYDEEISSFLYIENWIPVVDTDIPTLNAILEVQVPHNYEIYFKSQKVEKEKIDTLEAGLNYKWSANYLNTIDEEECSPNVTTLLPKVTIVPEKFKFELDGSFSSWKNYGDWQYNLIENLNYLPKEEIDKINSLVAGTREPIEKIRILYHYLQDVTRYVNITIETGGMKPYPASYVATNKYGDCKALTNYFKAILEVVGIKSYYTKVYADDVVLNIDKEFPSQQFNHVILNVPLGNDTIWLDCTSKGPFNYLGTFTQNRDAFVVDKGNSHFLRTPALSKNEVVSSRNIHVKLNKNSGDTELSLKNIYRGYSFEYLSNIARLLNETEIKKKIIDNFVINNVSLINYQLTPSHRDSTYISLTYNALSDDLCKKYGNEIIIKLLPFTLPVFEDPKYRENPVQISFPICKIDTIEYSIPENYTVMNKLSNQSINSDFGTYSLKVNKSSLGVEIIKEITVKAGNYPLEVYRKFYEFMDEVSKLEANTCIIIN